MLAYANKYDLYHISGKNVNNSEHICECAKYTEKKPEGIMDYLKILQDIYAELKDGNYEVYNTVKCAVKKHGLK